MYGYIFLYFILCVSFAIGMFVGEYRHEKVSKSTVFLYIVFCALAAPILFFALLGEFLVLQSKVHPTTNAVDTPALHRCVDCGSDLQLVCPGKYQCPACH